MRKLAKAWDETCAVNEHKALIAEGAIEGCRAVLNGGGGGGGMDAGQKRERV
jgi:hypothetical protein